MAKRKATAKKAASKKPEKRKYRGGPLTVTNREAKLSGHGNLRTEKHGDADVLAVDISVVFGLYEKELEKLLGVGSHNALYTRELTTGPEPRFRTMKPLQIEDKIEKVDVTMRLGLSRHEITFNDCKLGSITLTPETGGMTRCKLQIQAHPVDEQLGELSVHLNHEIEIDLKGGRIGKEDATPKADQSALPLDAPEPAAAADPAAPAAETTH